MTGSTTASSVRSALFGPRLTKGLVHCPICTRNVEADVIVVGRRAHPKPGQKCPKCNSILDAGYVLEVQPVL